MVLNNLVLVAVAKLLILETHRFSRRHWAYR